jgi:hypothetical protein
MLINLIFSLHDASRVNRLSLLQDSSAKEKKEKEENNNKESNE